MNWVCFDTAVGIEWVNLTRIFGMQRDDMNIILDQGHGFSKMLHFQTEEMALDAFEKLTRFAQKKGDK